MSLKEARAKADEARKLKSEGVDPGLEKKRKALAATIAARNTFNAVAEEVIADASP